MKHVCMICLQDGKLVRDHCHRSGMIRGLLCDLCNSYLGLYERGLRGKPPNKNPDYLLWKEAFAAPIRIHLNRNMGIPYHHSAVAQIKRIIELEAEVAALRKAAAFKTSPP